MVAVLIERENRLINECFGVFSVSQLPVFGDSLFSIIVKNIFALEAEKIIVNSSNIPLEKNDEKIEIIEENETFKNYLLLTPSDYTAFFYTDVYFEFDKQLKLSGNISLNEHKICAQNGGIIGFVLKNENAVKYADYGEKDIEKYIETLPEIKFNSYEKRLEKPLDYKDLIDDILTGKTFFRLPEIAQGIYAETKIPQGDFVIIPPVYLGQNVQIERGSVIGPNTVVFNNTLISQNSNIRNTVLSDGCYISSGCFVDDSLLCPNVSVRRNSVIFPDTVIGRDVSVGEDCVIENNAFIRPFSRVDDFKKNYVNFKPESNQSPAGFYGYTPEKAALLGASVGVVFNSPKIAVAGDGEFNSTALKLALLGGLMTTGANCYDFGTSFMSSLHYFMRFCELDYGVFVSGNSEGTVITIMSKNSYSISNSDYYNLKNVMTSPTIERCGPDKCKNVRQIHGMQRMYIQNLVKHFRGELDFMPVIECENKRLLSVVELAVAKIGFKSGKKRVKFIINCEGTKLTAECNGKYFSHKKLLEIVSYFINIRKDIGDEIKNNFYDLCYLDAVILCFVLMDILSKIGITLDEAYSRLPSFYVAENTVPLKISFSELASDLSRKNKILFRKGELQYEDGSSNVKINKTADGKLRIAVRAMTIETAREIVGDLTGIVKGL